ncbi:MAG TPA: permease-like cell division protein FtsX [Anaerolineae bacterium]|nr:permease-like cell division protein FtsX [Anaerolineae bacterium]
MYAIKEAIKGLAHTRSMAVVSIITITVALVILGILSIVTLYGHGFINSMIKSEEINVFLKDEMSDADMLALDATLISMSEIESTRIMTKEDAAKELEKIFKKDLLAGLENNPLPRTIILTLAAGHRTSEEREIVAGRIKKVNNVESVEYGQEWSSKLDFFFLLFMLVEIILITIVITACLLIITNTISLTVIARHETIEIMRLVGATESFIRRPFYYEGFIQGLVSGTLAFFVLSGVTAWVNHAIPDLNIYLYMFKLQNIPFMAHRFSTMLIIPTGAFMGFLGSIISVRRAV